MVSSSVPVRGMAGAGVVGVGAEAGVGAEVGVMAEAGVTVEAGAVTDMDLPAAASTADTASHAVALAAASMAVVDFMVAAASTAEVADSTVVAEVGFMAAVEDIDNRRVSCTGV